MGQCSIRGMWELAPKDRAGAGTAFGEDGAVVNVTCVSVNVLPKPLLVMVDLMLLLELHQKRRAAGSNIRIKWFYVIGPPNSEVSSTLKKQTKYKKNQQIFFMWFSLSFELNSKPVSSYVN